jgi:hypothetical protein
MTNNFIKVDPMHCGLGTASAVPPTRPPTTPGGAMATSPCVGAPVPPVRVRDCIDYHGVIDAASTMGFDYDDVQL